MRKLIMGFASVAVVVMLMMNFAPSALHGMGNYMFETMDTMATEAWEGGTGEYADATLNEYGEASQYAIDGLTQMSTEVLTMAEQEAAAQGSDVTEAEAGLCAAMDEACNWVLSFIMP